MYEEIARVPIFAQPIYSMVAILGVLAYEKGPLRWQLLCLNAFVMLGMQIRAEWLALGVALVTWCVATRRAQRLLQAGMVLTVLFALMYITDLALPGPEIRGGGEISVRNLADRALAVLRVAEEALQVA